MAQKTLLDIVQKILSDMDSDNVNSIDDTEESEQVTNLVLDTYEEMVVELDLPPNRTPLQLAGATSPTRPTEVVLDDSIVELGWIKYNHASSAVAIDFNDVAYVTPEDMIQRMHSLDQTLSTVGSFTSASGVVMYYENNRDPGVWTSFDDKILVFDSYDVAIDASGLSSAKLAAYGAQHTTIARAGTSTFPIGRQLMSRLVNDARETAFDLWKEGAPPSVRRKRVRSETRVQRNKSLLSINRQDGLNRPDYGRKSGGKRLAGRGGVTTNTVKPL